MNAAPQPLSPAQAGAQPPFAPAAFAKELRHAMTVAGAGARRVARESAVSPATVSRAARLGGWPTLSHNTYLHLRAWVDAQGGKERTAA